MAGLDLGHCGYDGELRVHALRPLEERAFSPSGNGYGVARQWQRKAEGESEGHRANHFQL